uniref:WW domain-containing protein n=1 Tax=Phytophthora ramorum TaxID=164328 RepID=H3H6K3_PHYRM
MRTEGSSARIKKKKRSSERSKRHDKSADEGEWKQFTSPDGHPYFYNAVTKESKWELLTESVRSEHRQATGGNKQVILEEEEDEPLEQNPGSKKDKKKRPKGVAVDKQEAKDTPKSKNATFQKLQASLEGRFNAMNGPMMGTGRPPPMLSVRRWEEDFAGGATESETKTPSLEEQYEAETVGMSAAERLRFLRKKRQENMMTKRESVSGDDFMAEVASNMKKKEAIRKPQEKNGGDKVLSWKEKEEAEGERKRQQMQAEMEVKEQEEARKEREQQAATEQEQRREQDLIALMDHGMLGPP